MIHPLRRFSINQQLALLAAGLSLCIGLALVALGAASSHHMQQQQQERFGLALAQQISRRISTALETGDLLSVAASLQRFVATSAAEEVAIYDLGGKALGQAGAAAGEHLEHFRAPVRIDQDIAGEVVITLSSDAAAAAYQRLLLSLIGLTILLSLAAYGITHRLARRLTRRIVQLTRKVALEENTALPQEADEIEQLARSIDALPMDLLRRRSWAMPGEEHYEATAVLYLQLDSLAQYVSTLDQPTLEKYIARIHRTLYTAAGFYGGKLQVMRQFGVCIYFAGSHSTGGASGRAAACSILVRYVFHRLERELSLSVRVSMALALSDTGPGGEADIYPGLYLQHTIDKLQRLCELHAGDILLGPEIAADAEVRERVTVAEAGDDGQHTLRGVREEQRPLLRRQAGQILEDLAGPELAHPE